MRRVALIHNPASGSQRARRAAQIDAVLAVLRQHHVQAEVVPTHGPGTAGQQATQCVARGCDTVFACGGDGTVHEVLQGLVGSPAALGVIPLGTANALAIDLGVPRAPADAARALLSSEPLCISVGRVAYRQRDGETGSRYFTVAAGVGPDAHLMYQLNTRLKNRFGYSFYIAETLRIWATHDYPLFEVELGCGTSQQPVEHVSQLLAVRISNFGGMLRRLAPGAALQRDDLRLVLFKTRSRARYLRYMSAIFLGREPRIRGIELTDARVVQCRSGFAPKAKVYVEADGELLGTLPARIEIVPNALRLLVPAKAK